MKRVLRRDKKNKNLKKVREIKFKLNFNLKTLFIIFFTILFFFYAYNSFTREYKKEVPTRSLRQVVAEIKDKRIKKIEVIDNKLLIYYKNGKMATSYKEPGDSLIKILHDLGVNPLKVNIIVKDTQTSSNIIVALSNIIPAILMIGFFIFIFKQAKGAQDNVFSFGQSKARRFKKGTSKISFKDVAGVDEAKAELEEIVDFLKNPQKYRKVGARTPKGVILIGPAGCGKTLLAKAVAGEANVPFFSIAGSEFMEMLVGIGAARVRDLFNTAKKSAPAIIFIDEIDAIGRARSVGTMPSHDEREQTLNQILVEMDGFTPNEQVIVMAATNRGDLLDPALLRPGRFDRRIIVDYPDLEGRKAIIKIHARGKPFKETVQWEGIARRTVGFSGADIENMLNEAAILSAREERKEITNEDIEEAATKVKLGPEKKRLQSDHDKEITAYHEAGHAITAHFLPQTDPVHRISIVSRGLALGYTLVPPAKDKLHESMTQLLEKITVMMGGRAAEETVFKEITTGAANDFNQATQIAKAMVIEYGMSKLGPINYGPTTDVTEWGKTYYQQNQISEETRAKIDEQINEIVKSRYKAAIELLKKHRHLLDKVAQTLIKKESLNEDEFRKIVA